MEFKFTKEFLKDLEELFSENWYYRLIRFIKFIGRIPREIKFFFQRGFRGYDDTIYWDLDDYLGKEIIKHLKHFKNSNRHGISYNLCVDENGKEISTEESEKKWNEILDKMILGFEELIKDPIDKEPWILYEAKKISKDEWIEKTRSDYKKAKENAKLFIEYFDGLWS